MPTQRLLIDGSDHGHFFLSVHDGMLTVGADPAHADLVLPNLRVVRIRCEVEVDEGRVVVSNKAPTNGEAASGLDLLPGQAFHIGRSQVSLAAGDAAPAEEGAELADIGAPRLVEDTEAPAAASAAATAAAPALMKRLFVIDGADKGRAFPLNVTGRTAIGKSAKHADIVLHDLYVARVHCELQVEDDRVTVIHVDGQGGTLVNGNKVTEQTLQLGDIVRVGNSQLRLELDMSLPAAVETIEEVEVVEVVETVEVESELVAPIASPLDALFKLEGQTLGHYQIESLLGRGQSGLVFNAVDLKGKHAVALKVLAPAFPAGDAELQALVRVLKAVAPLRHTHLVTLFGAGKTGPYCWIAREHVEGENLAGLIERLGQEGRLGWKRACRVAVQLGWVLNFLQLRHVIHSNITPANILVESATKTFKLADVMLDKALEGSRLAEAIREERLLAELPYRAPEQLEAGAAVDHRASLYALGTVLYALLAGQPPFSGVSADDLVRKVREAKLVKPSKCVREIPPAFEAAILKLLCRRPEDRYQSAAELVAVVEPIATEHKITLGE